MAHNLLEMSLIEKSYLVLVVVVIDATRSFNF